MIAAVIALVEGRKVPDTLVRQGIRRLLRQRLADLPLDDCEARSDYVRHFIDAMGRSAVAVNSADANEQHYEIPAAYYDLVLGARKKYSSCYWSDGVQTLEQAEEEALRLTCEHAGLEDGQQILELGCGWGSLTLWMAEHYPRSRITAVSNSASQRSYIEDRAAAAGFDNVQVITADMNDFEPVGSFDRIVSVEMFEHMRNWRDLFARVNQWLAPEGRFLMHVFCHRNSPYFFEDEEDSDWMTRYFFSGGMMPGADLPLHFQQHLKLLDHWAWNGNHYARTLEAWLHRQDDSPQVPAVMQAIYGDSAAVWEQRWRLFYMACAELFAFNGGNEWYVGHYLFGKGEATA